MVGKTVAHYQILKSLGRGGMGEVFLAQDLELPRKVALKFLSTKMPSSPDVERLVQEARLASRVTHTYICQIYETREVDGQTFIAMEYVDGETLRERLRRGRMPRREALRLGVEIAQALQAIHEKGMVHRDLKPANVMVTRPYGTECHVKLMDFGLATQALVERETDSDRDTVRDLSPPGSVAGTIAYMAPERFGRTDADKRSDIFAFGVILYEMLTGAHPFRAATPVATLRAMAMGNTPSPLAHAAEDDRVPALLEHIVGKMLERDPDRRYQSAREVFTDLEHLLEGRDQAVGADQDVTRVAVLPFVDASSRKDQEFLCDGIVEDLIYALETLEGLRVSSRTSVFRVKDQELSLQEIGRKLNVNAIVEGSLRREGDRLRIMARLVDLSHGSEQTLWSRRYDRQVGEVFEIQDEISQAVVAGLKIALLTAAGRPLVRAGTGSFDAYELYLKARFYWNQRTEDGLGQSVRHFQDAIQRDPGYAQAHAGLADAYATLSIYGVEAPTRLMPLAKAEAERALDLAEQRGKGHSQEMEREMAWALAARGCIRATFDWDWGAAERDFMKAIRLRPANEHVRHWYATRCLIPQGRFDEARFHLQFAREFDRDNNLIINTSLGLPDYFERKYTQAIDAFRKTLALDENFGMARYFLGLAYAGKSLYDDAIVELERASSLNRKSPETVAALAYVCAAAGRPEMVARARTLLGELIERSAVRYVSPVLIAQVEAALGEKDKAFEQLDKAYEMRSADLVWLRTRPTFDSLRSDRRFGELCARIFPAGRSGPESMPAFG